jgi:hypothetical protein
MVTVELSASMSLVAFTNRGPRDCSALRYLQASGKTVPQATEGLIRGKLSRRVPVEANTAL